RSRSRLSPDAGRIYPLGVALGSRRLPLVIAAAALVVVVALVAAVFEWSGATLASDPAALAHVDLQPFAGKLESATATGPGGRPPPPVQARWFPPARSARALPAPAPAATLAPTDSTRLTRSKPAADVFGSATPKLSPSIPGHWRRADSHTLVFTPSGFGAPFATHVHVDMPRAVAVAGAAGRAPRVTRQSSWFVPPGSPMRLQQ